MQVVIDVSKVNKSFRVGGEDVDILKGIEFQIKKGDFTVVFGPSGSGKSTLLHTMLGLEPPSTGEVSFLSEKIYENTDEDDRGDFRKRNVGMIYQQPNWVRALTVVENVAFPLTLLGVEAEDARNKAFEMLKSVGIEEKAEYAPTELSSGQQQRIALARALVNDPQVIIADEPTGNLDFESGRDMMQLLYDLNKKQKKTIIMVTHDLDYLKYASRAIQIMDGKIVGIYGAGDNKKLLQELKSKRVLGGKLEESQFMRGNNGSGKSEKEEGGEADKKQRRDASKIDDDLSSSSSENVKKAEDTQSGQNEVKKSSNFDQKSNMSKKKASPFHYMKKVGAHFRKNEKPKTFKGLKEL